MKRIIIISLLANIIIVYQTMAQSFVLHTPQKQAQLYISKSEPSYLQLAVQDFVNDVQKITGSQLQVVHSFPEKAENVVVIASVCNKKNAALLKKIGFDAQPLDGKWESSAVKTLRYQRQNILLITGSDERGTMFGMYGFLEDYLKVDPLYFWSGREPEHRTSLQWTAIDEFTAEPSFKYRGWFINDEDLLTEWENGGGKRNIDYPFYSQVVTPTVMQHVVEALVRSRYNLIIPASFIDILNPAEERLVAEAAKRGVFLSQHHIEPLGVSGYSFLNYWKAKGKDYKFSFYSHPKEMTEIWTTYAKKWAQYPNVIWQIGLRGIADRPMWQADDKVPQSNAERGRIISEAMAIQMDIIKKYDKRKEPLITTTLWAEGSYLKNEGYLTIPENITIVFSDNSPGWKWQTDFYSTPRDEKNTYGVYYHHQLWGSGPHLAQVVPPHKTFEMLRDAHKHQSNHYAILNVSNVREFVLGIDASSKMMWNISEFNPDSYLKNWIDERFPNISEALYDVYQSYYSSFTMHPKLEVPMFMDGQIVSLGSTQLRLIEDKLKNPQKYAKKASVSDASQPDAFYASLSAMHPKGYTEQEMMKLLYPERLGFNLVGLHARPLLGQLPENQKQLFYDNLVFPNALMIQLCQWLEQIYLADEAVDAGNVDACREYLAKAIDVFPEIRKLSEKYCYGKWKEWYRGETKMNLKRREEQTLKVLELAKSVQ